MALPPVLRDRLRLPVIGSPLFIISNPDLVIAQCKAGIVGSFPALNARPVTMLDEWLHRITEELAAWDRDHPETPSAPFAVNHIVHKSNDRLEQDVIIHALEEADGRRNRAAQMLGISQRTLIRRLKLYGVKPSRALPVSKLAVVEGRCLREVN